MLTFTFPLFSLPYRLTSEASSTLFPRRFTRLEVLLGIWKIWASTWLYPRGYGGWDNTTPRESECFSRIFRAVTGSPSWADGYPGWRLNIVADEKNWSKLECSWRWDRVATLPWLLTLLPSFWRGYTRLSEATLQSSNGLYSSEQTRRTFLFIYCCKLGVHADDFCWWKYFDL